MDEYQTTVNVFDKFADKYQEKYMDFEFYFDTYDIFCDLIEKKNADIFEIACGPGNITKYILNKRPDFIVRGIDAAPGMVDLARKNIPTAMFEVMDCRNISSITAMFDAIVCGFCLPYLCKDDAAQLICDMRSLVRKDGTLYLSTMEDDYENSGFQTSSTGDQVYTYYHQFDNLETFLASSGFQVINVKRKQFPAKFGNPATDLFIYAKAI